MLAAEMTEKKLNKILKNANFQAHLPLHYSVRIPRGVRQGIYISNQFPKVTVLNSSTAEQTLI